MKSLVLTKWRKAAVFIVLFSPVYTWATTYYVDFLGGNDAGTGTIQTAPWQHCPGDVNATNTSAATALSAGDIVIFKGGVSYLGTILVSWSGDNSSDIVYDGNTAGTWGAGKAMIDGENVRSYGFYASSGAFGHVTVRNFEIQNMKYTGVPWQGGAAIKMDDASNVTLSGCYLHDVGYWNNDGSIIPAGNGVHMLRPNHCTVTNCEITRTGLAGIEVDGSVNCTFSHNNIHDYITWGIDIGGDFNLCTGNIVSDNSIHDLYQYDAGYWQIVGDTNIPHTDYVFLRQGGGQRPINNTIERNFFYNNQVFNEFGGTAMVFLSYADTTTIRNNVFINSHEYCAIDAGWGSTNAKIYNNTFYSPRVDVAAFRFDDQPGSGGGMDVRNNIIVSGKALNYNTNVSEQGLVFDRNIYMLVDGGFPAQAFVRISGPALWMAYSDWISRSDVPGLDAHSVKLAAVPDIGFVNPAGYPLSCQTMDLRLVSTSPAVNAGVAISGILTDLNGVTRPQGAGWDIGAYEYVSGAPAWPQVPAGLKEVYVFPSPAKGKPPTIRVVLGSVDSLEITIFDNTGALVRSVTLPGTPTGVTSNGESYFDYTWTEAKASGVFFAVIHGKTADGKVVKARVKFAVVR